MPSKVCLAQTRRSESELELHDKHDEARWQASYWLFYALSNQHMYDAKLGLITGTIDGIMPNVRLKTCFLILKFENLKIATDSFVRLLFQCLLIRWQLVLPSTFCKDSTSTFIWFRTLEKTTPTSLFASDYDIWQDWNSEDT